MIQGNLALQPKKKQEQAPAFKETKRTVVRKKTIPTQEKLLYMFTIAVCVLVAGLIIFRYAQIYQMNLQIKQLETKVEQLAVDNIELRKQVEALSDPGRIRDEAIGTGMVDPDKKILVQGDEVSSLAMNE